MSILAFSSNSILDATTAGKALLTAADAAAQRSLLGLGTLATQNGNIADYLTIAAAALTYQPLDSDLTAIAGVATQPFGRNLLAETSAATLRSTLGLGTGDGPSFTTLTLAGQSLTGSGFKSLMDLSTTWNTTGTPSAISLNITDTASDAQSLFLNFQIGGATRIRFRKDGQIVAIGSGQFGGSLGLPTATLSQAGAGFIVASSAGAIGFSSTTNASLAPDVVLVRDAANILAQRNGVTAQTFRIYNTFTDASNYECGFLRWESNILQIGSERSGTGTARQIRFVTNNNTRLSIAASVPEITIGGEGSNAPGIFSFIGGAYTTQASGRGITVYARSGGVANDIGVALSGDAITATSGSANVSTLIHRSFTPTSGTGVFQLLRLAPVINQTGGANGASRAIVIAPSLTAAADYAALESSQGSFIIGDTYAAGSGSLAGSLLNLSQTWNTTGTPTAINLNVTDTASNAASLLLNLRVGGSSRFSVDKNGSGTFSGKVNLTAATTLIASLNVPSGTAPSSPNDGDIWFDGTNLKIRTGGVTKTFMLAEDYNNLYIRP